MLFGSPISGFPPSHANSGTHAQGVSRHYAEPPCLGLSVLSATLAGIELTPRSLLASPDVGITGLDLKPKRVRVGRCVGSWEARSPSTPPLHLGCSPLRTGSLTTLSGRAVEARQDWSVRVRVSLSSSERGRRFKTRACARAPTCARAARDRAGFARWAKAVEEAAGGAAAPRQAADFWRPPSRRGEGWRAEAGVAAGYREQAGSGVAQGGPGEATPGPTLPLAEPSPTGLRGASRSHLSPFLPLVALQTPDPPIGARQQEPSADRCA